jgi:hypothetical protein
MRGPRLFAHCRELSESGCEGPVRFAWILCEATISLKTQCFNRAQRRMSVILVRRTQSGAEVLYILFTGVRLSSPERSRSDR